MDILALDLSLSNTGVALPDGSTKSISSKLRGMARLHEMDATLRGFLDQSKPDVVAIESYSFASQKSQAHALGELGGVIRLSIWRDEIPIIEIPPTNRAKFATGKGNAGKSAVVSAVSARTGRTWDNDDELDAWVLQEMVLTHLGEPRFAWPNEHRKALDKIDWSPIEAITKRPDLSG